MFMWFFKFYVAYVYIFSDLNYKTVIFLSQTESTPKHFLEKKALCLGMCKYTLWSSQKTKSPNDAFFRTHTRR
jgi:hypothetical protein